MSRIGYTNLATASRPPVRDSLELASLASSDPATNRTSLSSSPSGISSSRKLSLEAEDPLDENNPARRDHLGRSYSVTSAFDFTSNLFPLSATALGGYAPIGAPTSATLDPRAGGLAGGRSLERQKSLTYLNGLSLLIGLIIGSGIFSSPSQVNANAGSPGASLLVWAVAGALVWTGAASYAELGGAIPLNGGAQVYLSKIFGELAGFLFTWSAVCVIKPGSAAIIAIIFGEYVVKAATVGANAGEVSAWVNKAVALAGLLLVTLVNCVSTKLGTRMSDLFMFFKFAALIAITVIGVVVAVTGFSWNPGQATDDWKDKGWFEDTSTNVSSWAVALYAGLWAFDGWDNVSYVVGEFRNPHRDLPRIIHTAMPLVILSYLLANVAYIFVLPTATIESSNTVAVTFGSQVFGRMGALVLALVVSASCIGALNATTFTASRLVYAASKEGYLPSTFGHLGLGSSSSSSLSSGVAASLPTANASANANTHTSTTAAPMRLTPSGGDGSLRRTRSQSYLSRTISRLLGDEDTGMWFTPIHALLLNATLCSVYIVLGNFRSLIVFNGVAGYSFYFLTVLGVIVLRVREPRLDRPYRTWLSTPIIFCCVSLFLLSRAVFAQPLQTVVVAAFVAAGVPVYYLGVRRARRSGSGARSHVLGTDTTTRASASVASWWKFWERRF
ncbi:MAG: hypothetical protein M1825_003704 [Sarcosagium campestre]|nr:MAG: hypothetical protein M1825_003704 [Sarcosagium campestre]